MSDTIIKDLFKFIFKNPYTLFVMSCLITGLILIIMSGFESQQKDRLKLLIPGVTLLIFVLIIISIAPFYFLVKTLGNI